MDVDIFEGVGRLLELRVGFQHNVILIQLSVDRGDLALAEGVVQSVVDVGGKNAEARGGVAVNREIYKQAAIQLIAGDVAKLWNFLAADAVFNSKVLHRLHEEGDALNFVEIGLKAADDVGGAEIALRQRLKIDLN